MWWCRLPVRETKRGECVSKEDVSVSDLNEKRGVHLISLSALIANLNMGFRIEGIGAHRKGEQERVMFFEVFHVGHPFKNQEPVSSVDIIEEMGCIRRGKVKRDLPGTSTLLSGGRKPGGYP